jgi:hypothetical protein
VRRVLFVQNIFIYPCPSPTTQTLVAMKHTTRKKYRARLDLRGKYARVNGKKIGRILKWEFGENGNIICHLKFYKNAAAGINILKEIPIWEIG